MTPDEHEAQRRMVWIEAMKAAFVSTQRLNHVPEKIAEIVFDAFDTHFPAPKSENEG